MVNKNKEDIVIINHKNEKYYTIFNKNTGLFIRSEYKGYSEPFWDKTGPELIDISITNWCDKKCSFCYRDSNINGKHMSIGDFEEILRQAKELGVFQIALGGGNPNQHPNFIKFLKLAREKYGIVPSYTTNGRGLTKEIIEATKNYCGAVAVSMYNPYEEFKNSISTLIKNNIKTNIHYLLSSESVDNAIYMLTNKVEDLEGINSIIFLNYKPVGKKADNKLILNNNYNYKELFRILDNNKFPFKIGFDSCSISGVLKNMNIDTKYIESCEAGRFSAFISEEMKFYPCSFMEKLFYGYDLREKSIKEIWLNSLDFNEIRDKIENNLCSKSCDIGNLCNGGCPIFNEINLC
ncbi:radical SAM additional 4Fe4S-binding domain protein [[Clostridium] sordellii]|uniref:radical SAM/SPASM domain-containing protein n=1 Tax=Paraclostridium sordellii TaxID=1505 RepID=UPI0005E4BD1B|nr:radical SAM protein [Paeniclostridium sordellii]CEP99110.1 radical SAM additional 4Fe4S-binding domain protein [[Clostridium] sordellii] [Paeniclostridium sordellii]